MDATAWANVAAWGPEQQQANPAAFQQESGRIWDVLWMLSCHLRGVGQLYSVGDLTPAGSYGLYRIPADHPDTTPRHVTLNVHLRLRDGEPQILLSLGEGLDDGQSPYGDDDED